MTLLIRPPHILLAFGALASAVALGCDEGGSSDPTLAGAGSPPANAGSASVMAGSGGSAASAGGGAGTSSAGASGAGTAGAAAGSGSSGLGGALATGGTSAGSGGANIAGNAGAAPDPFVHPRGTTHCDEAPLNLGEMHLLTNEWTDPLADTCVFLDMAGRFGWKWTRGATGAGDNPTYPNYPELEFGINPWNSKGIDKSTTTLLPLQLKDITSASMTVDVHTDVGGNNKGWNLAFELWLSDKDPRLGPASPKGEIMVFLSNAPDYYPTAPETQETLNDGIHTYKLYVSSDNWGSWGYYRQYRLDTHDGKYNGKLDIGAFLEHYVNDEHWDGDLWVTRFELGNEVYQNSAGTTTFKSVSFEVNGQTRESKTQ